MPLNQIPERQGSRPLIGLLADDTSNTVELLYEVFSYLAHWHGAELCLIRPGDRQPEDGTIAGYRLEEMEWKPGIFRLPDVVYDRLKQRGKSRYRQLYSILKDVPASDRRRGISLSKLSLYERVDRSAALRSLLIPHEIVSSAESAISFIHEHGSVIVKPDIGSFGQRIVRIESAEEGYVVSENLYSHRLSREQAVQLLDSLAAKGGFLIQKYVSSQTKDGLPFHVRVHCGKDAEGRWRIVSRIPYLSVSSHKKIVNHSSAFRVFCRWTDFLEHQFDDSARRQSVNRAIEERCLQLAAFMDSEWPDLPLEIGIDIAIDADDRIWLFEANINKVGAYSKEIDLAKLIVPSLLARIAPADLAAGSFDTGMPIAVARKSPGGRARIGVYRIADPLRTLPEPRIRALLQEADNQEIELFFFDASSIDPESRTIRATYLKDGQRLVRTVPYPDIVCNEWPEPSRLRPPVEAVLRQQVPFTTHLIPTKYEVQRQLRAELESYLLPTERYESFEQLDRCLEQWGAAILKPNNGRRGENVYRIRLSGDGYGLQTESREQRLDREALRSRLDEICEGKVFLIQQFWPVATLDDEPVDYRVHVQRGGDGEWTVTRLYPRIGGKHSIVANLSRGGRVPEPSAYWNKEFGDAAAERQAALRELALRIAKLLNRNAVCILDELGIDLLMNRDGAIRFLEANAGPESRFHEEVRARHKLAFAKHLIQLYRPRSKKEAPLVGMMTVKADEELLREACAYAAGWNGAGFFHFRPQDVQPDFGVIRGYEWVDGEWKDSYFPYPDVVYDRYKQRGAPNSQIYYDWLKDVPFNETRPGGSFSKLKLYRLLSQNDRLRGNLLPFEQIQEPEQAIRFIDRHGACVLKPSIGTLGERILLLERDGDHYIAADNLHLHRLNKQDLAVLIGRLAQERTFLIQRFVLSETRDGLPYYLRLHKVRLPDGSWQTAAYVPTISLWAGKKIVNHKSVLEVFARWKAFSEYEYPAADRRQQIQLALDRFGAAVVRELDKRLPDLPGELALDLAIDADGHPWLLEANMNLMGSSFREFEIAKAMIPAALALVRNNKSSN